MEKIYCLGILPLSQYGEENVAWHQMKSERLQFLRREQKALQADCYQDLRDALIEIWPP